MGFIYKITNKLNNKIYIGQTVEQRPTDRYSKHRYMARHIDKEKSVSVLHRAMNKYGLDNFSFEIIEEVENDLLNQKEKEYIQQYNSLIPNGYNLTIGGEGTPGYSRVQSAEEKEKRKESNKNFYILHPEEREKRSKATKKLWQNEEYRRKVTESNIKFYKEHPNILAKENNPFYGKSHSEETKKKLREKNSILTLYQLDKDTLEIIHVYSSVREAEATLQVSHGWISKAARQNKIAYGYRWKIEQRSVSTN